MVLDPIPELRGEEAIPKRPSLVVVFCVFIALAGAVAVLAILIGYGLVAVM